LLVRARTASRSEAGVALLEVLVTAIVVGIAAVGITFMFSFGNTWVVAKGDDRVAVGLAQQKIEQLRSLGFACIRVSVPSQPDPCSPATQSYNEGGANPWVMADGTAAPAPSNRNFIRTTVVEFVNTDLSNVTPGTSTNTKRITVTVQPNQQRQADPPVILKAWITAIPGGI
jgi:type II secretory pathway pseudopilin PulG